MHTFHELFPRISKLYGMLQDDLSRDIFWARLQCDVKPDATATMKLFCLSRYLDSEDAKFQLNWRNHLRLLLQQQQKIILYGAGVHGLSTAKAILSEGEDFSGFCDTSWENLPNSILGKPIYAPSYLWEHKDTCYVIITTKVYWDEIAQYLRDNGFPESHILPYFHSSTPDTEATAPKAYFEFPEFFPPGTAFVDGGCYDGQDSLYFINWCKSCGGYSKIYAFEPDASNYQQCQKNLHSAENVKLFREALSDHNGTVSFSSVGKMHSRIAGLGGKTSISDELFDNAHVETVQMTTLDEVIKDTCVGFIKMDLEGAEIEALHGAEKVISRNRPLLAICVYHIPGDTLEIMDYLSALVPEYRFWLRHYGAFGDTVLYAAI